MKLPCQALAFGILRNCVPFGIDVLEVLRIDPRFVRTRCVFVLTLLGLDYTERPAQKHTTQENGVTNSSQITHPVPTLLRLPAAHASQSAASRAWYVRIRSAPARRMAVRTSRVAARSSSQPRSAAAFTIAYSPLTL